MTTRILIANYGPKALDLTVMNKGQKDILSGSVLPDTPAKEVVLGSQKEFSEVVYDSQYIVVKEQK